MKTTNLEAKILQQACKYAICLSLHSLAGGMKGMGADAAEEAQEALDAEQYKLTELVNQLAEKDKPRLKEIVCGGHKWVKTKLEPEFGVFGGMKVDRCSKCKTIKSDLKAAKRTVKRLKRNGLL